MKIRLITNDLQVQLKRSATFKVNEFNMFNYMEDSYAYIFFYKE